MQSVLKKWLFVGSAITVRISFVLSGGGGGVTKTSAVETPMRLAMGRLAGDTAAFSQVIGLRLFVCGSGTTRGTFPAGSSNCANCWPSSVGPCTGMNPPFGKAGTTPEGTSTIDKNIQGAGDPEGSPVIAMASNRWLERCLSRNDFISWRTLLAVVASASPG